MNKSDLDIVDILEIIEYAGIDRIKDITKNKIRED